ncbi:PolC-type DNA polymerase III [Flavimarina sp. Hel_I_48]|uniref:3'-5' exonuclease n=1 Tax=Flavimarina sp. Hel_I_48 TaxID=1392488 RepID=UPI00068F91A7|nr:3'-5' exonuclease [Flavimarina sp. Hel_I_48]
MIKLPFFDLFNRKLKNAPAFYKDYAAAFQAKKVKNAPLHSLRFVVFDTETTGLDVRNDRMLSIGAIGIEGNVINVRDTYEYYIHQEKFKAETVPVHGILKQGKQKQISEEDAVKGFLKFIGNSVLVGHHVGFDLAIINYALKRLGAPKLKNKALDTGILYKKTIHQVNILNKDKQYSLDELCADLKIEKADRHKAAGDAFITALAFLKIRGRLDVKGQLTYKHLTRG